MDTNAYPYQVGIYYDGEVVRLASTENVTMATMIEMLETALHAAEQQALEEGFTEETVKSTRVR
jgi:hypothetical protein